MLIGIFRFYPYFSSYSFIGDYFISGGFVGIIIYLLIGRFDNDIFRRDVLGVEKGQTLLQRLSDADDEGVILDRKVTWELKDRANDTQNWDPDWTSEHTLWYTKERGGYPFQRSKGYKVDVSLGRANHKPMPVRPLGPTSRGWMDNYQIDQKFSSGECYTIIVKSSKGNPYSKKTFL